MVGSATFTTVESSMTMLVPSTVATRTQRPAGLPIRSFAA
jgi:hypothetical protein